MSHASNTELVFANLEFLDLGQIAQVYPGPQQLQGLNSGFIDSNNFNLDCGFCEIFANPFSPAKESPVTGLEEPIPHFLDYDKSECNCEFELSPPIANGHLRVGGSVMGLVG